MKKEIITRHGVFKKVYEIETMDDGRMYAKLVEWRGIRQFRIITVESREEALAVIDAWEKGENATLATRAGREYFASLFKA